MENFKDTTVNEGSNQVPQLTSESASYLLKAAKWGKFLAILGYIISAFMFLAGILMSFVLGMLPEEMAPLNLPFSPRVFSVIYIVIAAIYLVPVIYLNSFCNSAIKAINLSSTEQLTNSLKNLKKLFVFIGIATIVILALYSLILLVAGIAALVSL